MANVMGLMKRVDIDALVREVQATRGNGAHDLDAMIGSVARSMLGSLGADADADAPAARTHTVTLSLADAHRGKRRRIRVKAADTEHIATYAVALPPHCADGHTTLVETHAEPIAVVVRVADRDGAFCRFGLAGLDLATRLAVSLADTRALEADVELPWGELVRVREARADGAPLHGWIALRQCGMHGGGTRGDLYVRLDVTLPATWRGVGALADIAPLHRHTAAADADTTVAAAVAPDETELSTLRALPL